MSKPKITQEQVNAIESMLATDFYKGDKGLFVKKHSEEERLWGARCLNGLPMDTLCRYLYAPDTVEIEFTVDEQLKMVYDSPKSLAGTFIEDGPKVPAFRLGMETALRIIGRQTPGVITWEE